MDQEEKGALVREILSRLSIQVERDDHLGTFRGST